MRLQTYLKRKKIKQQDFADRLTALRGATVDVAAVSRWVNGVHKPLPAVRVLIRAATDGAVKERDW